VSTKYSHLEPKKGSLDTRRLGILFPATERTSRKRTGKNKDAKPMLHISLLEKIVNPEELGTLKSKGAGWKEIQGENLGEGLGANLVSYVLRGGWRGLQVYRIQSLENEILLMGRGDQIRIVRARRATNFEVRALIGSMGYLEFVYVMSRR